MESLSKPCRRYDLERRQLVFDALARFDNTGLKLGRGTLLARADAGRDRGRIAALLAVAHRSVSPLALKHARRAIDQWQRGDAALAQIELAFARLPRLENEDDALRLFLAEALLENGWTPHELAWELGFDLRKYDPDQPRVPAGSGRESGRWRSGTGSASEARDGLGVSFLAEEASAATTETAGHSFLTTALPQIIDALAAFAERFSLPTAVLGALIIPTPNSGGVTQGTLPDAPDISYERDGPAGTLRLTQQQEDGSEAIVVAQSRNGVLVDVATGAPLGRDFGEQFYLDLATVVAALAPHERGRPATEDDKPQLCPAPTPDKAHKAKAHTLDYEDDVHRRVNPFAPIPRGFAVRIIDPETGEVQYPDDCFRYAGDLVDGDMRAGDFADAKGEEYASLLSNPLFGDQVMDKIIDATQRHLRAAKARGANLKVYFAEQDAADRVRERFSTIKESKDVKVGYLPPSRPKPRKRFQ